MQKLIDLHVHTTASDGSYPPAEAVRMAAEFSLAAVAITDHDNLDGLPEAGAEADKRGLELVRGCEISTMSEFGEIHILALCLPDNPEKLAPLQAVLVKVRQARDERNRKIADNLARLGIPVAYDELLAMSGGKIVGRPHFAELLFQRKVVANRQEAFDKYLRDGGLAFAPPDLPPAGEVVAAVASTGACASFAHPLLKKRPRSQVERIVARLAPEGLTAIEAYHSEHSPEDERYLVDLAAGHGLLLTGGSDFHGRSKPHVHVGAGKGNLRIPYCLLEKIRERLAG